MSTQASGSDRHAAIAKHVGYEYSMFIETAELLLSGKNTHLVQPVDRATLESFVIHFRNLYEFFFCKPKKEGDIRAVQFVPDWKSKRPNPSTELSSDYIRTHKHVAHLTIDRLNVSNDDEGWRVAEITHELAAVYNQFQIAAPKEFSVLTSVESASANVVSVMSVVTSKFTTTTSQSITIGPSAIILPANEETQN